MAPLVPGTSNPAASLQTCGGVARNVAENLVRLGFKAGLFTVLGDDADGQWLLSEMTRQGIDVEGVVRVPGQRTGNYTAVLDSSGEMAVAMADMDIYERCTPELLAGWWNALRQFDTLVADTNLPMESLRWLLASCRETGKPLCLVPVSSPKVKRLPQDLRGISLLVANEEEINTLYLHMTGHQHPEGSMPSASAQAALPEAPTAVKRTQGQESHALATLCHHLQRCGVRNIVVTHGQAQVFYLTEADRSGWINVPPVPVTDVTGCGDAFAAATLAAFSAGRAELARAIGLGLAVARETIQSTDTVSQKLTPELVRRWETADDVEGNQQT